MRVNVTNLGCKVNRVESDLIVQALVKRGIEISSQERAAAIVINTCAVTSEAEKKTRKAIRKAHGLTHNPIVVVTGCAVNLHKDDYQQLGERVYTEADKSAVSDLVCDLLELSGVDLSHLNERPQNNTLHNQTYEGLAFADGFERKRLGIKIQDGCDNQCTYCIIWKARGKPTSVNPIEVIDQINTAVGRGVHEAVLTGINLGSYSYLTEQGTYLDLADLLNLIMEQTNIKRVRLSSVEPLDAHDKLLDVMVAYPERICPHLHLALQSGCDKTLQEMARVYTTGQFRDIVSNARKRIPRISLSTDLIVGFPGETAQDFEQTYAFCAEMRFSKIHTFRYSPRPGTPAALRDDQVDPQTALVRSQRIRALQDQMRYDDALSRIGSLESVLIEDGRCGTSHSYHRVSVLGLDSVELQAGDLVYVRFAHVDKNGLIYGTYVPDRSIPC